MDGMGYGMGYPMLLDHQPMPRSCSLIGLGTIHGPQQEPTYTLWLFNIAMV